jgi:uncharacterized repeat protein (TIGR01451 family)
MSFVFSPRVVLWVAVGLLVAAFPVGRADAQRIPRFQATAEGEILITGNTLGLSHLVGQNGQGVADAIGTFISLDTTSVDNNPAPTTAPAWPAGTTADWRQNGSAAFLDLPTNKDVDVLWAELLWGGSWAYSGEDVSAHRNTPVTLRFESGASITVTPDPTTSVNIAQPSAACPGTGCFQVNYYIRSANVTAFIQEHGAGRYSVSGVPATQHHSNGSTNAAGWTLVVAYNASGLPSRNMAIWIDAEWVDERATGDDAVDFEVTQFCTPPDGPVTGQVLISAIEGDAARPGNQLLIETPAGGDFLALSAPNNPSNNFFCSQINDSRGVLDQRGTFGGRNHNAIGASQVVGARQGWDITGVELSDDHLANNQTSALLRATSTDDSYVVTVVAMAVDVNAPAFDLSGDAITASVTEVRVGDTVTITATLTNTGTAMAEAMRFHLPLPAGLSLVGFWIDGDAGDIDGDPVTTAMLTSGVEIGDIAPGETVVLTAEVEVLAAPAPPAEAHFAMRGRLSYEYVSCESEPAIVTEIGAELDLVLRVPRLETALTSQPTSLTRDQTATLRVVVSNTGTASEGPVTLRVTLPDGLTYQPGSTTFNGAALADVGGQPPFAAARVVEGPSGPAGTIAAGEVATVVLGVSVDGAAPNQVTVAAAVDPDGEGARPAETTELVLTVTGGTPGPICGNGLIEGAEECDDGGRVSGDGCSSACLVEPGWTCVGEPSVCERDEVPVEPAPDTGGDADMGALPDTDDEGGRRTTGTEACGCGAVQSSPSWAILLALGLVALRAGRGRRTPR